MLAELIDQVGTLRNPREGRPDLDDHYGALVRAIVGQQLSVLAAKAIYGRLTERFSGRAPTTRMRSGGMSPLVSGYIASAVSEV